MSSINQIQRESESTGELIAALLAAISFCYALYIAIRYANQALLDNFSFRQTQTALTAYWLKKDGFSFAYETPVAGPPWSIPFEFPLYQYLVALISKATSFRLDAIGRVVSFAFLALCLVPVRSITRSLRLPNSVFYVFAALLFSSPLYLYYGRTFMMETAAVFFCVAAIKYFIDLAQNKFKLRYSIPFLLFMTLGLLQKVTTGLPVLAVLGIAYCFLNIKREKSVIGNILSKDVVLAGIYFGIPLALGAAWTLYTDHVKISNGLGVNLTSSALSQWNWGTLDQRISLKLFKDVIWTRMFVKNLAGGVGLAILFLALFSKSKEPWKKLIIAAISMGIIPFFLFTNLHIIHEYYQTANLIFLIYAVAMAIVFVSDFNFERKLPLLILIIIMMTSNYYWFSRNYLQITRTVFNSENSRDYAIAGILKKEIPEGKYFVAFGDDWNSALAYLSQRKSFTVPEFFRQYKDISLHPEQFFPTGMLSGVVMCPPATHPSLGEVIRWAASGRQWKVGEVQGCYIAVPEAPTPSFDSSLPQVNCQGSIDTVKMNSDGSPGILSVSGWIVTPGEKKEFPEKVYVTLNRNGEAPLYFEALQVNRPDIDTFFHQPDSVDFGFSREIDLRALKGEYTVGLARMAEGKFGACQFHKDIPINGGTNQ